MVVRSDVKLISSRVRECTPRKNPHATVAVGQSVGIGFAIENVDWLPLPMCIWRDKLDAKCYRDFGRFDVLIRCSKLK